MKITGFTIIKNAILNDYPVVESITSILPVVDEMIVAVGESTDDTRALIASIASPKIRIIDTIWEPAINKGGAILAVETDKAAQFISPDTTWAFYIQADEVIHEKYHEAIKAAALQHEHDLSVEGLLFNYLHFYGTYDYVGDSRKWYHKEVRIIRNDRQITAFRDAQGFRKAGKRLKVKQIDACVYHYGWVKSPRQMQLKRKQALDLWSEREDLKTEIETHEIFNYADFDSLEKFTDSHPLVMQERIDSQNWQVSLDINQKVFSLKDRLLYWFEKKTGVRLFGFRNYEII